MRYPLELVLQPSLCRQGMIAAIHGVAAIAFLYSGQPFWLVVIGVVALLFSAIFLVRAERSRVGWQMVLEDSGLLTLRSGERISAALPLASSTDFGWAVWLHWRTLDVDSGQRRMGALMLLPDQVDAVTWRGLRIWLRHKCGVDASADGPRRT